MSAQQEGATQRKLIGWGVGLGIVAIFFFGLWAEGAFDTGSSSSPSAQVFGAQESGRLVERLQAAKTAQGICYGWEVDNGRYSHLSSPAPVVTPGGSQDATPPSRPGVEYGSNLGAGTDPRLRPRDCPKWVVFVVQYTYSAVEDEWTGVLRTIQTNLPLTITLSDLDSTGIIAKDLIGDNASGRLADSIGAIPLIVAEKGGAASVPEAGGPTVPANDKITAPSTKRYWLFGLAGILIIGGLAWIVIAAVRSRSRRSVPVAR